MIKSPSKTPFVSLCFGAAFLLCLLFAASEVSAKSSTKKLYRQSAYITNAYYSDKIAKEGKQIQPLTVVKSLQTQKSGVVGYFVLDLILTHPGRHEFKVNILDKSGKKVSDLTYPVVKAANESFFPLYTAVGSISSSKISSGLWFFKVYDRVNGGTWHRLGTFAVTILVPEGKKFLSQ
jgi:hypothetical protein